MTKSNIYYSDATEAQRDYIRTRINNDLGNNQSALVTELLNRRIDGFGWDYVQGMWPSDDDIRVNVSEPIEDSYGQGDVEVFYDIEFELDGVVEKMTVEAEQLNSDYISSNMRVEEVLEDLLHHRASDEAYEVIEELKDQVGPAEIFEWYSITSSFVRRALLKQGEAVLQTDYGDWWGRSCTGQAILLDHTFWDIYQEGVQNVAERED